MQSLHVKLEDKDYNRLKRESKIRGVSMKFLVTHSLDKFFSFVPKDEDLKKENEELKRRVEEAKDILTLGR